MARERTKERPALEKMVVRKENETKKVEPH